MTKRELKTALNKQAILKALLTKLRKEEFSDIKISDLCDCASVSQASFYNYFPQKTDILIYYIQLWLVEMYWLNIVNRKLSGLDAIDRLFDDMAEIYISQPKLLTEIMSLQIKNKIMTSRTSLSKADKQVAFPSYEGIESIVIQDIEELLSLNIQQALEKEELLYTHNPSTLVVSLMAILLSVPIIFSHGTLSEIKSAYRAQLDLFMYGAVHNRN